MLWSIIALIWFGPKISLSFGLEAAGDDVQDCTAPLHAAWKTADAEAERFLGEVNTMLQRKYDPAASMHFNAAHVRTAAVAAHHRDDHEASQETEFNGPELFSRSFSENTWDREVSPPPDEGDLFLITT